MTDQQPEKQELIKTLWATVEQLESAINKIEATKGMVCISREDASSAATALEGIAPDCNDIHGEWVKEAAARIKQALESES